MRTPVHSARPRLEEEDAEALAATPAAAGSLGPQALVPQDGSPELQETPGFAGVPEAFLPAPAGGAARSARKSGRQSKAATPAHAAEEPSTQRTTRRRASMAAAAAVAAASTPEPVSMSPTEQVGRAGAERACCAAHGAAVRCAPGAAYKCAKEGLPEHLVWGWLTPPLPPPPIALCAGHPERAAQVGAQEQRDEARLSSEHAEPGANLS